MIFKESTYRKMKELRKQLQQKEKKQKIKKKPPKQKFIPLKKWTPTPAERHILIKYCRAMGYRVNFEGKLGCPVVYDYKTQKHGYLQVTESGFEFIAGSFKETISAINTKQIREHIQDLIPKEERNNLRKLFGINYFDDGIVNVKPTT